MRLRAATGPGGIDQDCGRTLACGSSDTPLRTKDIGIWPNPVANRPAPAWPWLSPLPTPLRSRRTSRIWPINSTHTNQSALVVVEAQAHAEALSQYLPSWPVVTANESGATGFSGLVGTIATAAAIGRLNNDSFDVLVRLDAGVGLPPLPSTWLETTHHDRVRSW